MLLIMKPLIVSFGGDSSGIQLDNKKSGWDTVANVSC